MLSLSAFATTPDPCKTDAATLALSPATAAFVSSVTKLAEDGKFNSGDLWALVEAGGNPIDFASGVGDIERHVWKKAFETHQAEHDFDRPEAAKAITRLALQRENVEDSRDGARDQTARVVWAHKVAELNPTRADDRSRLSINAVGDKETLFWLDVDGLRTIDLATGLSGMHTPMHFGRAIVAEPQADGTTLFFSATPNNPPHFHQHSRTGVTDLRDQLPTALERFTTEAGPVRLGTFAAVAMKPNPYMSTQPKPAVMWFKISEGRGAKVHRVEIESTETGGELAAIAQGPHSFIALSSAKRGEVIFVDANAEAVHWKPALGTKSLSTPVFYRSGDGVRAAVWTGRDIWVGDPVSKTEKLRLPMPSDGANPLIVEREGKHYAVASSKNEISVVDLDAGKRAPTLKSNGQIRSLRTATLGSTQYLIWMEGPEIVIADFATRAVLTRQNIGEDAEFHLFHRGNALHAVVKQYRETLKDFRLIK